MFGDNTVETVVAFWAVLKANAVVSIVNPLTKADKLEYLPEGLPRVGADHRRAPAQRVGRRRRPSICRVIARRRTIVAAEPDPRRSSAERERSRRARRGIDIDLAAIIYTSGSTGDPKGVMLTHRNMLTAATSITTYLEIVEDDVILGVLPLAFDYGLYQMIMAFRRRRPAGARALVHLPGAGAEGDGRREASPASPACRRSSPMLAELKNLKDYDFSKIRYVTNTAAALPVKHITMLRDLFPTARIYSMYGLTECKRCTYLPPEDIDRKPTSVGIAIPNTELWLVDEDGPAARARTRSASW